MRYMRPTITIWRLSFASRGHDFRASLQHVDGSRRSGRRLWEVVIRDMGAESDFTSAIKPIEQAAGVVVGGMTARAAE
jgi:hypothetical protein